MIRTCSIIWAAQVVCYRSSQSTHCSPPILIPLEHTRRLPKTISYCGKCLKRRRNSRRRCDSGRISRNSTLNSVRCTRALRNGRRRRKNFVLRQNCNRGMQRLITGWERRCCNKENGAKPETLYSLGKAASLEGDAVAAEKAWAKLLSIEKASSLAAQTHFALAGLYRKQGKTADAEREMQEFQKLQNPGAHPEAVQK